MKKKILYLSWNSINESLVSSQVVEYLNELSSEYEVTLITFEQNLTNKSLEKFRTLQFKKFNNLSFIGLFMTLFITFFKLVFIIKREHIDALHCRSYIPAILATILKKLIKINFIFDMRGYWFDEKLINKDFTGKKILYSFLKKIENILLKNATFIVTLSEKSIPDLVSKGIDKNKIFFIPTCTNLEKFKVNRVTDKNKYLNDRVVIGYIGSIGTWQMFEEVIQFYKAFKLVEPKALLLVLNKGQHKEIHNIFDEMQISTDDYLLKESSFDDVPFWMNLCHVGVFFNRPNYSKIASCPTKMGEFLGCGIPVVSNSGVGDVEKIINSNNCGLVVNEFTESRMKKLSIETLSLLKRIDITETCRNTAEEIFSKEKAIIKYRYLYSKI